MGDMGNRGDVYQPDVPAKLVFVVAGDCILGCSHLLSKSKPNNQ